MLTAIAFLAAGQHHFGSADPGLIGLAISYSLSVTGLLQARPGMGVLPATDACEASHKP